MEVNQYTYGNDTNVQFTTVIEYGAQGSETSTQRRLGHEKEVIWKETAEEASETRAHRFVSKSEGRSGTSSGRRKAVNDQGHEARSGARKKRGWVKYTSPDSRTHSPATRRAVSRPTKEEVERRKQWRLERNKDERKHCEIDHGNSKEEVRDGMKWVKYSGAGETNHNTKGANKNRYQTQVTEPSLEEIQRRRQWRSEAREAQEKRYRALTLKKEREERAERERLQARREQHRIQVMERFERRRNMLDIDAEARERAHENYIALKGGLKGRKLLHQRLREEYERKAARARNEKRQIYYETLHRYRSLRPREIRSTNVLSTLPSTQGYGYHEHTRISRSNPNPARQGAGLNYVPLKGGYSRSVGASPMPSARLQSAQLRAVEGKATKTEEGASKSTISNRSVTGITRNDSKQCSTALLNKGAPRAQTRDHGRNPLGGRKLKSSGGKSVGLAKTPESLGSVQKIKSDGTSTVSSTRLIASKTFKAQRKKQPATGRGAVRDVSTYRKEKKPTPKSKRSDTPRSNPAAGTSVETVKTTAVSTPSKSTMIERELSEEEWREILAKREKNRSGGAITKQMAAEDVQEEGALKEILTKRKEESWRLSNPAKEVQEDS